MVLPSIAVVVVLAAATYRTTRVATTDTITSPLRARLYDWAWDDEHPIVDEATGKVVAAPRGPLRTWVHELLTCPNCLGVWFAALAYCAWRWGGDVVLAVLAVLAVAGVQSVVASFVTATEPDE